MRYPVGKTPVQINEKILQENMRDGCRVKHGDVGYIDGYLLNSESLVFAVFVREDGVIEPLPLICVEALFNPEEY